MMIRVAMFSLLAALGAGAAQAQEAPYLDNRSNAATLVRSLYNAINRKEYNRAWSYYGDEKPSATLQAFADGYKDTKSIDLSIGQVTSEGAAGSTVFNVPIAIAATGADDQPKIFAGCFTARLANPQVQGDNFAPLHIEKGSLKPSDEPITSAVPKSCGEGQAVGGDAILEQAKAAYAATYGASCDRANAVTGLPDEEPSNDTIKYKLAYDEATAPDREARLMSFPCFAGAYNFSSVFYLWTEDSGLRPQQFSVPQYNVVYENPQDTENSKVEEVTVTGYSVDDQLTNSEFDPATNTLMSFTKWRGVGDTYSTGHWVFRDGQFALVRYAVDATYNNGDTEPSDEEEQVLVDYETTP